MKLRSMIWKELWKRPSSMLPSLLAITLGVTAMVASRNITISSDQKNAEDMESLKANVLVLPPAVTLQDYYAADVHGYTMPDEYASRLALAKMPGVKNVAPILSVVSDVDSVPVLFTGILPQSELHAKSDRQDLGSINTVGSAHCCCGTKADADAGTNYPKSFAMSRNLQELGEREVILGQYLATQLGVNVGDDLTVLGETFAVLSVLPSTGTIDDSRLYAHLHSVQDLSGTGPVVNAIEIMACCEDAAESLMTNLSAELPEYRIITIAQVVQALAAVNGRVADVLWVSLSILLSVGGMSLARSMYHNVTERRKEIGTLKVLGASRSFVILMFLGKATLLGLAGGLGGFVVGTALAAVVGQQLLGVSVQPMPHLLFVGIVYAVTVTIAASFLPATFAAVVDPCLLLNEAGHSHQRG
ncbi:ABC transporter permease [Bythopirellula goksoeyrii]|uniref:Putative ABC transporter permease YknZ n=1 Tax=Bythopirellula goksoeyrii TaxID=1400387 RepID=A0A5B9QE16_9BACT|nr:FtsX-like permease family protein [Bythopirellula goksoeyrii]QEG35865.1 putative ABC transporter permease YknZ [Bythopirellula goksoeyrii]